MQLDLLGSGSRDEAELRDRMARALAARLPHPSPLFTFRRGARRTRQHNVIFSIRASARRTSDTEFSSWPTPCQQDGPKGGPSQGEDRLPAAAALSAWPTPKVQTGDYQYSSGDHEKIPLNLSGAAKLASWPTPMAQSLNSGSCELHAGGGGAPRAPECAEGHDAHELGDADDPRSQGRRGESGERAGERAARETGVAGGMGDAKHAERRSQHQRREDGRDGADGGWAEAYGIAGTSGQVRGFGGMGDTARRPGEPGVARTSERRTEKVGGSSAVSFWSDAEWLYCRDGKWRPAQSGIFPLAHGPARGVGRMRAALERLGVDPELARQILRHTRSRVGLAGRNRTGRLRGYGNALCAEAAVAFIEAYMSCASECAESTTP